MGSNACDIRQEEVQLKTDAPIAESCDVALFGWKRAPSEVLFVHQTEPVKWIHIRHALVHSQRAQDVLQDAAVFEVGDLLWGVYAHLGGDQFGGAVG